MYTELVGSQAFKIETPANLASAAVKGEVACMLGLKVRRFMALVSTVTVGACTIVLKKRPVYGSSAGESVIATIIIPAATAAGKVVYKDLDSVDLLPGMGLAYEVTAAATSGAAVLGVNAYHAEEHPQNLASMIASA